MQGRWVRSRIPGSPLKRSTFFGLSKVVQEVVIAVLEKPVKRLIGGLSADYAAVLRDKIPVRIDNTVEIVPSLGSDQTNGTAHTLPDECHLLWTEQIYYRVRDVRKGRQGVQ